MSNIVFNTDLFNFKKNQRTATLAIVELAVLTAIVIVLQLLGSFIRFGPFSITLVLIPIVLGAALYGPLAGLWLGFVFGGAVLLSGDAAAFLAIDPFGTVVTVLLKGMAAGFVSGLLYNLIAQKSTWAAAFAAAFVCPVVNTGVFLLGCLVFFMPTINEWSRAAGFTNAGAYMIIGLVGLNFLVELAVDLILAPGLHRLLYLLNNSVRRNRYYRR